MAIQANNDTLEWEEIHFQHVLNDDLSSNAKSDNLRCMLTQIEYSNAVKM